MPSKKKYLINFSAWEGFFCLPHEIADKHLKLASPTALKVIIYILRQGKANLEQKDIADKLGLSESAVSDALMYWCGAGILSCSDMQAETVSSETANATPKQSTAALIPKEETKSKKVLPSIPSYSSEDIAKSIDKCEDLKYLLARAEEIFARPLSNSAIMTLFTLYDWDGISVDIICMVMERCSNQRRLSVSNIANEARRWQADGISTVDQADQYIILLDERQSLYGKVKTAFGIGQRNFSKRERDYIDSWHKDFGYGIDIITLAFDACVNAKGSMSFSYINKVLSNWNQEGIRTPKQVEDRQLKFKQSKEKPSNKNKNTSYDLESEAEIALKKFGQAQS